MITNPTERINYRNIDIELEEKNYCCWWGTRFALGSHQNREKAIEVAKKIIDVSLSEKKLAS